MSGQGYEYRVNLHVHSTFSDGSGEPGQILDAARKAGLDILLFNDHDTLEAKDAGWEGYHGRLLVLVGMEYSGPHNHYLAYGVTRYGGHDWRHPQTFIDDVRSQGGIGFIAHPFEKGSPFSDDGHAFTWEDWDVNGFDGICIWNYTSSWKRQAWNLPRGMFHYFFRKTHLPGPDRETLSRWDERGQNRPVSGVAGSDAHAWPFRLLGINFPVFPYSYLFRAVNTHLLLSNPLTREFDPDREAVLKALAGGSCFMGHDRLHDTTGFDFWLADRDGRQAGQGEEVSFQEGLELYWRLPAVAPLQVVRNGKTVHQSRTRTGRLAIESPGVYRLEAFWPLPFFGPRPWIFSNPVYVRPPDSPLQPTR